MNEITQLINKLVTDKVQYQMNEYSRFPEINFEEISHALSQHTKNNIQYYFPRHIDKYDVIINIIEKMNIIKFDNLKFIFVKKLESHNSCSQNTHNNNKIYTSTNVDYYRVYTNYSFYINLFIYNEDIVDDRISFTNGTPNRTPKIEYVFPYFPQYAFTLYFGNYCPSDSYAIGLRIYFVNEEFNKYSLTIERLKNYTLSDINSDINDDYLIKNKLFKEFLNNYIKPCVTKQILPELYLHYLSILPEIHKHKWLFSNVDNYRFTESLQQLEMSKEENMTLQNKLDNKIIELYNTTNDLMYFKEENENLLQKIKQLEQELTTRDMLVSNLQIEKTESKNIIENNTEQIQKLQDKNNYLENELLEYMKKNKSLSIKLETTTDLLCKLQMKDMDN